MKKSIAVILALVLLLTTAFVACKKDSGSDGTTTSDSGLVDNDNVVGIEEVPVTDENGKEVTDENGEVVTTEVAVIYETDKHGKTVAKVVDVNGEVVTNKKGKPVTVKSDVTLTTEKKKKKTTTQKTTASTTIPTKKGDKTTEPDVTTKNNESTVPKTSDSGERVTFSSADQQIIKSMLEVPYLYLSSYENSSGVPIDIATHAAMWMVQREGLSTTSYAAGTVVIDLFKYFDQTVVNFKSKCNSAGNSNIKYRENSDTFVISSFEDKKQDVTIDHIERFGDTNYYKVVGTVKNADGKSKVVAVIKRNRLDNSLGFSIKALKWS